MYSSELGSSNRKRGVRLFLYSKYSIFANQQIYSIGGKYIVSTITFGGILTGKLANSLQSTRTMFLSSFKTLIDNIRTSAIFLFSRSKQQTQVNVIVRLLQMCAYESGSLIVASCYFRQDFVVIESAAKNRKKVETLKTIILEEISNKEAYEGYRIGFDIQLEQLTLCLIKIIYYIIKDQQRCIQQAVLMHHLQNPSHLTPKIVPFAPHLTLEKTSFVFPQSRSAFQNIKSIYEVRTLVRQQTRRARTNITLHMYQMRRGKTIYIYGKCTACKTLKIRLLKRNQSLQPFKLAFFDNSHTHGAMVNGFNKSKYNIPQIFNYLKTAPKDMTINQFKNTMKDRYGLTQSNTYYILERYKKCNQSFVNLVRSMKKDTFQVWVSIETVKQAPIVIEDSQLQDDPFFFMFSLPQMIQHYQKYGQLCYLSMKRGLVKKTMEVQERQWDIIALTGLTFYNRFAPFFIGFLQTSQHTVENIALIVANFFLRMGSAPKTLITPLDQLHKGIIVALKKNHSFEGTHLYDGIQYLQHIQKIVTTSRHLNCFQDLVHSRSKQEYYQCWNKLFKTLPPTLEMRKLVNDLQKKASLMCFGNVERACFMGMQFKYSANRYFSIMINYLFSHSFATKKIIMQRPKELYFSVKMFIGEFMKLIRPSLPYVQYNTWKFEHYMNMSEMLLIRNNLKTSVLEVFLSQLHRIFSLKCRERSSNANHSCIKVYDVYDSASQALFVVTPQPVFDQQNVFQKMIWRCNCLYSYKCGMPCCHELKVALMNGTSLLEHVSDRWIQLKVGQKKAPGRPRVTRRNTQK